MTPRSHLSIGEVLSLLQDEFPDITISKIRFLESQGLLDPERTPSGYRKFYEDDIERLRWILRQQKENFLPLKVIKDRLASGTLDEGELQRDRPDDAPSGRPEAGSRAGVPPNGSSEPATVRAAIGVGEIGPTPAPQVTGTPRGRGRGDGRRPTERNPEGTEGQGRRRAAEAPGRGSLLDSGETGVSLTRDEILGASGLTARDLGELEGFGLVESRTLGNTTYYDEDALVVARLAAGFMGHGVQARHLRMYKVSAEREAGVFEQLIMPLLKQRNPGSRQQSAERLDELASLGGRLRAAMLRQALRDHLGAG